MEDIKARRLKAAQEDEAAEAALLARTAANSPSKARPRTPNEGAAGTVATAAATADATADGEASEDKPEPPRPSVHPALPEPRYNQHDTELVTRQFSAAASSGIRALPDALHPDFRMELYGALVILGKERHEALRQRRARNGPGALGGKETLTRRDLELATATTLLLAHSTKGSPQQEPVRPLRMHDGHAPSF
jgi:hypothetical protein